MSREGPSPVKSGPVADRHSSKAIFAAMVDPGSHHRILVLHGEPEMGKTYLVEHFRGLFQDTEIHRIDVDFDKDFDNIEEIFTQSLIVLGRDRLRNFWARKSGGSAVSLVTGAIQVAWHAEIQATLTPDPERDRLTLAQAWFEDLMALDKLLVITIDCFEAASEEQQRWMRAVFLPAAARCPQVRIVIASAAAPALHRSWSSAAEVHQLAHIMNASDWLPVLTAMRRKTRFQPADLFLEEICKACEGRPRQIHNAIEGFDIDESLP